MDAATVIAFVVILEHALPVPFHMVRESFRGTQFVERVTFHSVDGLAEFRSNRPVVTYRRFRRQINEDKSTPNFHTNPIERKLLFAEPVAFLRKRRVQQAPLKSIGPLMIGTTNPRGT